MRGLGRLRFALFACGLGAALGALALGALSVAGSLSASAAAPPGQPPPSSHDRGEEAVTGEIDASTSSPQASPPPPAEKGEPPGGEVPLSPKAKPPPIPEDKTLKLSVPAMERVEKTPVENAPYDDREALDSGALHPRGTGFPWAEQANVYIAGHRLGYAGTGSFLLFYDLDEMGTGDLVRLEDALGREYRYSVTQKFVIDGGDTSVMRPVPGKNVLTLQTCTLPDYTNRLIVRAQKVG